ncbi:MAG: methyltransferase domain-containing protein [Myxococcota bacterium]
MSHFTDPAVYERISTVQAEWGRVVVEDVVGLWGARPVDVLADLGCGSGRVTEMAVRALHPRRVICQDVVASMASATAARVRALGCEATESVGDAASFTTETPCDIIFSTAALHWVLDHDGVAQAIHNALAPGGLLRAQCGGAGNLRRASAVSQRIYREVVGKDPPPYPARFAGAEEWTARLTSLGMKRVDCRLRDAPAVFPTPERFEEFVRNVVLTPWLRAVPEGLQEEFMRRVVEAAVRELELTLDYVRLELTAWK